MLLSHLSNKSYESLPAVARMVQTMYYIVKAQEGMRMKPTIKGEGKQIYYCITYPKSCKFITPEYINFRYTHPQEVTFCK